MHSTEEIWLRYHSQLLAFIRKRVSDMATAEDILQDIFVRIHSRINTLESTGKLENWLYQITRNSIVDFYRSRRPTAELPEWLAQPQTSEDERIRKELSSCLSPMIQQLPEKYLNAVQLSEIEGNNLTEIADKESISLSGAKSRVQRGRALLKTMLDDCCKLEINAMNQIVDYDRRGGDGKLC